MSRDFFQQTHKLLESEKVVTFVPLVCSAIDFAMVSKDLSLFNLTLGTLEKSSPVLYSTPLIQII